MYTRPCHVKLTQKTRWNSVNKENTIDHTCSIYRYT